MSKKEIFNVDMITYLPEEEKVEAKEAKKECKCSLTDFAIAIIGIVEIAIIVFVFLYVL